MFINKNNKIYLFFIITTIFNSTSCIFEFINFNNKINPLIIKRSFSYTPPAFKFRFLEIKPKSQLNIDTALAYKISIPAVCLLALLGLYKFYKKSSADIIFRQYSHTNNPKQKPLKPLRFSQSGHDHTAEQQQLNRDYQDYQDYQEQLAFSQLDQEIGLNNLSSLP